MYARNALNQYANSRVQTAGKAELVTICYEKAIEHFSIAKMCLSQKNFQEKAASMQKGLAFVNELQCSLDFEKGGQIALSLDSLYNYIHRKVLEGDIQSSESAFEEVIQLLTDLKEAWEAIAQIPQQTPATSKEYASKETAHISRMAV